MKVKVLAVLAMMAILLASTAIYLAASSSAILTKEGVAVATIPPSPSPAISPIPLDQFRVPILMYHYIRSYADPVDELGAHLSITPERFGEQLDYLKNHGYQTVSFADLRRGKLPDRPIIITFDDGYADAYTAALSALQARQMRATFYVVSGFVGTPGYVTWEQLREMEQAGMEIGAHTVDHADLAANPAEEQRRQIFESIQYITEQLGGPVTTFAYPSGKYNGDTLSLMIDAGITYAVTIEPGVASSEQDPRLLPRLRVEADTNFDELLK